MKPLLMIVIALFLTGCGTTAAERTVVKVVACKRCAPPPCARCAAAAPCVGCQQAAPPRQAGCTEGRIQGESGQVFRVECPGGRVAPEAGR